MRAFLWAAALVAAAGTALAGPPRIAAIEVQGLRMLDARAALDLLTFHEGEALDRARLGESVKRLFRSGLFRDVEVRAEQARDGVRLVLRVKENPIIATLRFEGNDEFSDKTLKTRLKMLRPGRVLSPQAVHKALLRIRKGYFKKGYYQVQVEVRTHERSDGRVDVVVAIDEGAQTRIKRIGFLGVHAFAPEELAHRIISKAESMGTAITDRDVFARDKTAADVQLIEEFYQNRGFLDARVESATARVALDRSGFILAYGVREGVRYRIGEVRLSGDLVPSEAALRKRLKLHPGEWYSLKKLRETIEALTEAVGEEGYAYANVTPLFRRDPENGLVDVTFEIEKGPEIYIRRIEITGNERSDDETIRRELRQDEAARYDARRMRLSKRRVKRLESVKDARFTLKRRMDAPNLADLDVELEEQKTGSLSFGIGYSQLEKTFIQGRVSEKNLFGKGYQASFNGQIGARTQNFTLSFTDPYFLGDDLAATWTLYNQDTRFNQVITTVAYQTRSAGGSFSLSWPIGEFWSLGASYRYDRTNLANVPAGASLLVRAQAGRHTTGELGFSVSYDTRDRTIAPTDGAFASLALNAAGLGGTSRFTEARLSLRAYHALDAEGSWVLAPAMELGAIGGPRLPLYRRYSLGGLGSVRGFDYYGISLRDPATQEALGGNRMWTVNLNLYTPVPGLQTAGFRGVVFADAGTVWGAVHEQLGAQRIDVTQRFSSGSMRASVGFGFEWISPIGPIGMYWGFPVRKQAQDVVRRFEFALGAMF